MSQATTIGLDIAKTVFHAHGAEERGAAVFSRKLSHTSSARGGGGSYELASRR